MEQQTSSPFQVAIDFDTSHLYFPNIMHWVLLVLGISIVVFYGRDIVQTVQGWVANHRENGTHVDAVRLFGTLGLVIAYFLLMEWVGQLFPNTGMGFLLVSIPFMLVLSLLYVHDLDRRKFLAILANSVISPVAAWYVLAQLFYITLP